MSTHEEVEEDAARIAELVKHFEESKEWETQGKVFELLERIDHMHRACIWRIYELTTELGGKGLVERLQLDPTIKTLFILYDLLPAGIIAPVIPQSISRETFCRKQCES